VSSCLVLLVVLLLGIPILAGLVPNHVVSLFHSVYRTGSLVFGRGHVIRPLLQAAVVPPGWIDKDLFLAGYGAAQAALDPLFTFSAYLGALMQPEPGAGGLLHTGLDERHYFR
jgi:chromate transporter